MKHIDPEDVKAFYIALWTQIAKGCNPAVLKKSRSRYGAVVFFDGKSGTTIGKYLLANPEKSTIDDERYFYRRYRDSFIKKEIEIEDAVLYNSLLYMGYKLPESYQNVVSLAKRTKALFDIFKISQMGKILSIEYDEDGNRVDWKKDLLESVSFMTAKFIEASDFLNEYYQIEENLLIESALFNEWRNSLRQRVNNVYRSKALFTYGEKFYERLAKKLQGCLWSIYEPQSDLIVKRTFSFGYNKEFFKNEEFSISKDGSMSCPVKFAFNNDVKGRVRFQYISSSQYAYFLLLEFERDEVKDSIEDKLKKVMIIAFNTKDYVEFSTLSHGHILTKNYDDLSLTFKQAILYREENLSFHDHHPSISEHSYTTEEIPSQVRMSLNSKWLDKDGAIYKNAHYTFSVLRKFEKDKDWLDRTTYWGLAFDIFS